jgi:prepilin-type N-terminal cleavage/methylation domain-containing protein
MKNSKKKNGFTLIELLVVIAIIALLATLITVGVRTAMIKAKITKAQHDTAEIAKSIQILEGDTNLWPGHQPINIICSDRPGGCPAGNEICGPDQSGDACTHDLSENFSGLETGDAGYPRWNGPYMNSMPLDAWGHHYFFDTDYQINAQGQPIGCGGIAQDAVVAGSYGPDGEGRPDGAGAYGCDDVIYVLTK